MAVPLLRWGIENSDAEALQQSAQEGQTRSFDPELVELMLGKDDATRMRECVVAILDDALSMEERLGAFELLLDLCGQIDNANNVAKMGLWDQLWHLVDGPDVDLSMHTIWLVAVCVQNNPEAAEYLMERGSLERLVKLFPDASPSQSRKIVSALSALFQCSPPAFGQFVELGGLRHFQNLMESNDEDENLRGRILHALDFYCGLQGGIPKSLVEDSYFAPLMNPVIPEPEEESDY